jgi:RimJ/RimL family protein N-acetyltransferase
MKKSKKSPSIQLKTARLRLRSLERSDIPSIQKAASFREISDTMISVPHPYPEGEAERYFERQQNEQKKGRAFCFVMEKKQDGAFCGIIELRAVENDHSLGELSFWLAVESWGQGYMSEGLGIILQFAFETLKLNRLYAFHMERNPATGRVLEKNGFRQEGMLRERVIKWGKFEDVALCAILKMDWIEKSHQDI